MSGLSGIWVVSDGNADLTASLVTLARQLAAPGGKPVQVWQSATPASEPASQATGLASAAQASSPRAILFGATSIGKDWAPRVAASLKAAIVTNVQTAASQPDGSLLVTRPCFAETYLSQLTVPSGVPAVLVVRAKAYAPSASVPEATLFTPATLATPQTQQLSASAAPAGDKPKLQEANIVVSGGRGLQAPENFALVEDLAAALGAAVGATRAIVDAGWRPHSEQVGQTGKSVSPQVYFALGISGAMQHLVGMNTSRTIVAINRDAQAPIFKIADFGIVGDVLTIAPALTAKIKAEQIKLVV
jgi:electron transfer flavoprotein alpha subunit